MPLLNRGVRQLDLAPSPGSSLVVSSKYESGRLSTVTGFLGWPTVVDACRAISVGCMADPVGFALDLVSGPKMAIVGLACTAGEVRCSSHPDLRERASRSLMISHHDDVNDRLMWA